VVLPDDCLHRIFEMRAHAAPNRVALSTQDEEVTYGELNDRAGRVAARLVELGVGPDVLVGLCAPRSVEALVGIIGILMAGGAYVPIDPDYPVERIEYLLADCAAPVVVAARASAGKVTGRHPAIVWIDGDRVDVDPDVPMPTGATRRVTGRDLAYVIYTSGSTGTPKGVAVEHRNVVRLLDQTQEWFHFDDRDVWTLFHSISFDFSVWEVWGALAHGGRLVLLPTRVSRSPELLVSWMRTEQVTVLNQTPSAFRQCLSVMFGPGRDTSGLALRLVIFGGERLDPSMLAPWVQRHGDRSPQLVNMYGITETTVHCTYRPLTAADVREPSGSPIGVPLPDLRVYLLDAERRPVPTGTPGEVFVAGPGLARGYLNRPALTAERFVSAPEHIREDRLYRSGDQAVRTPDGGLTYLGRLDDQLKVRGYRIEPGEIEECLATVPGIAGVVVTSHDYGQGDLRLVAHLLPEPGADLDDLDLTALTSSVEQRARTVLPQHLRPSHYQIVSEIPMTLQGKVNRHGLAH
jgi:amino acid adenylation domain-containing protein